MQGGSWEPEFEQKKELDLCITTTQIEKNINRRRITEVTHNKYKGKEL